MKHGMNRVLKAFPYIIIMIITIAVGVMAMQGSLRPSQLDNGKWKTICVFIGFRPEQPKTVTVGFERLGPVGAKAILYVANTSELRSEGYKFKDSIDFNRKGAVGMVFLDVVSIGWGEIDKTIIFTMKDVKFPLVLLVVAEKLAAPDVIIDEVYMEPEKEYKITIWRSWAGPYYINNKTIIMLSGLYFIELDPLFARELKQKLNTTSLIGLEVSPCG
jgi:uncharacterized membrane protein (UPF0127 family)